MWDPYVTTEIIVAGHGHHQPNKFGGSKEGKLWNLIRKVRYFNPNCSQVFYQKISITCRRMENHPLLREAQRGC